MQDSDVLIIEVALNPRHGVLFQALLQGEDGLAVPRRSDARRGTQQLWTTPARREALMDWLESLPEDIEAKVVQEWLWRAESGEQR